MGDARFDSPYARIRDASDRKVAIEKLHDAEVIVALGAASRNGDPYIANVLTTEALNRHRRLVAWFAAVAYGAAAFILPRIALQAVFASPRTDATETWRIIATIGLLVVSGTVAVIAYLRARRASSLVGF